MPKIEKNQIWHSVWKSPKMSHLNFNFQFWRFCPIKSDLSGNTIWPKASGFKNSPNWPFLAFLLTFTLSNGKRSSLRSQCWMRLFCDVKHRVLFTLLVSWSDKVRVLRSHVPGRFFHYVRSYYILEIEKSKISKKILNLFFSL